MTPRNWREVRAEAGLDEDRVAQHKKRMVAEIRAARLMEVRTELDLTQTQLAERMHVSQARESARKYITALGDRLEIVADFGDRRLTLG